MVNFPHSWRNAWNQWDIRVFVLISLLMQILLVIFAPLRKRKASKSFALFIWSTYLLADWVATLALGLLCNSHGDSDCDNNAHPTGSSNINTNPVTGSNQNNRGIMYNDKLLAFWAPFLLLHLGGPDAITAFAMEDNELWPRHLVGFFFEVGVAVYAFLLSIPNNPLLAPTLFMFLAGVIKYGERKYTLYLGSMDGFRDTLLHGADPGMDYGKLIDVKAYMAECGVPVKIYINQQPMKHTESTKEEAGATVQGNDFHLLLEGHKFFNKFKGIMADLLLSFRYLKESRAKVLHWDNAQEVFRVIEFELGFLYELFFTKAVVVHQRYGYILRAICSCSIMAAFLSFFFISKRQKLSVIDIYITYTLLGGAICLDACSFVMFIFSDLTIVQLQDFPSCKTISNFILKIRPHDRWSLSATQHSLIDYCIPAKSSSYFRRIMDRPTLLGKVDEMFFIQKIFRLMGTGTLLVDEIQYTSRENVTVENKEQIFAQLKSMAEEVHDPREYGRIFSYPGERALQRWGYPNEFKDSIVDVEFDESLLMWHIATDLCYYGDDNPRPDNKKEYEAIFVTESTHRKFCKLLSDYLMYLLVMRPQMMSTAAVTGKLRYLDTCDDIKKFLHRRLTEVDSLSRDELQKLACDHLLSVDTSVNPRNVKGEKNKSVLFDACILAKKLKTDMNGLKRWKIMSEVWIEMLTYAASRCPGIAHAQRLSKGGELLTFVWFLMTHLGLVEQSRVGKDKPRAQLIVIK